MRPRFEQNIAGFREEIERMDEATEEEEKMQLEQGQKLRPELEEKLNISADRRGSHEIAQFHIYELQKTKQKIVDWRESELAKFDENPEYEYVPENSVLVSNTNGVLKFHKNEKGDKSKISSGEILTD